MAKEMGGVFLPSHQAAQARRCNALPAQSSAPSPPTKTALFEPFCSRNDDFAKTGSGQSSSGKVERNRLFISGLNDRYVIYCGQKGVFRTACRPDLQCMSSTLLHACTHARANTRFKHAQTPEKERNIQVCLCVSTTQSQLSHNSVASVWDCLLYTSPSPRDLSTSRMPSSA